MSALILRRTLTTGLALLAGASAMFAAQPALAKSDVQLTAIPKTVTAGQPVTLTAVGGDDGEPYVELCVQRKNGRAWPQVRCVPGGQDGVEFTATYRPRVRGGLLFRAQLYRTDSHHRHWTTDRTSPSVRVTVK